MVTEIQHEDGHSRPSEPDAFTQLNHVTDSEYIAASISPGNLLKETWLPTLLAYRKRMCYTQDTGPRAYSNSLSHCKLVNWHLSLYFSLMSKFSVSPVLWAGATLWVWSRKHSGPFVLRTRFSGSPLARYCCQPGPSQDTACWHATRQTLLSKL